MDLRDTPEEAAFRKEIRDWVDGIFPKDGPPLTEPKRTEFLKWWAERLYEGGWAGVSWPKEYGGRGASLVEQAIYYEEMARAKAPPPINMIGFWMAGPTIIAHGTEAQKQRYLPKILSCEEIWCQGFSEPGAGSDLASLRTIAVLDGDHFVVNGQKVWTSFAHVASWCNLLVRTDPAVPKHEGLSYLLVDMHSPGIEVRPLKQMSGDSEFSEVFYTDVRVPLENLLGGLNNGWNVAITTLLHERGTFGFGISIDAQIALHDLVDLAKRTRKNGRPAIEDAAIAQRIGRLHAEINGLRVLNLRGLTKTMQTGQPGPEGSISKLVWSETMKRLADAAIEILGPAALLDRASTDRETGEWLQRHLNYRSSTIGGGTSEVMRNIIAERVLGLPRHK